MNPIFFVLPIIAILTYTLGLSLKLDDFRLLIKRPLPMFVGLFGQLILLPVIAFVIAYYSNLPVIFFVCVVLIACCPGGPSSNIFTYVAKGDVALSVSMTAVSSIVTLFTLPFIMALTVDFALAQGMTDTILGRVELPVGNLLIQNVVLMLIPILLGVATKFYFKNAAVKLEKVLSKFAFPALIFLATIFFVKHYHNIANHLDKLGLCVLALVLIAVATSSLLSTLFKQSSKIKRTIVIEVAMQNAAQAIAIASSPFVFNNEIMAIPAIIYALFMNVVLLTYVGFLTVRDKKVVAISDQ